MPRPCLQTIYSDLLPHELATLHYSLLAHDDEHEAQHVVNAVPRVALTGLHPEFEHRTHGLELFTWRWASARLKAEREVWRQAALVQLISHKLSRAHSAGNMARQFDAEDQLVVALANHARAESFTLALEAALDQLAEVGHFHADDVRGTTLIERYVSVPCTPMAPPAEPDPEDIEHVVCALRHYIEN